MTTTAAFADRGDGDGATQSHRVPHLPIQERADDRCRRVDR